MLANPTPCCGRNGHHLTAVVTRLTLLLGLGLGLAASLFGPAPASAAAADEPAGCSLLWQVQATTPGDGTARQLLVHMAFDAGPRSRTVLRLPDGWAGLLDSTDPAPNPGANRLQAVPDAPLLRSVAHAPGERVRLHWRYSGPTDAAQGGSVRLAPSWFALAGLAVLPVPEEIDERNPPSTCIQLLADGADGDNSSKTAIRWASSHGQAEGQSALFRLPVPAAAALAPTASTTSASTTSAAATPLRRWVQQALYAGGALDWFQAPAGSLPLTLVRPSASNWLAPVDDLGRAAVQTWADQRQFWSDSSSAAPLLLLLLPGSSAASGGNWHQALALQAPADLAWPNADTDLLLTRALLSTWVPDRFGPLVHIGRSDEVLRAWFSDGLVAYYSHRLLLRSGRMTPAQYAQRMNQGLARLASEPATATANTAGQPDIGTSLAGLRGQWLALQWHKALRAAGQPGLDAVLQRLLLAPGAARHEGPISAPLATHRLVAALRPVLGDAPLREIQHQADRANPAPLDATSLGPCFTGQAAVMGGTTPTLMQYQPVPQALQQADCQGWLGFGPQAQAAANSARPRLRSAAHAVEPDAAPAPRPAGKATGLKKGKSLHGHSGKAGAKARGSRSAAGSAKASSGKARVGKTSGGKSTKASSKPAAKRQTSAKKAGTH